MNICLDLSPVVHRKAGLATYARNIAEHLLQIDRANSHSAFYFGDQAAGLPPPLDRLPHRSVSWGARRWRLTVALDYALNRKMMRLAEGLDLFHATEHLLPPLPCRSVFTFHDAIYALFPQYHLPMNYWYLKIMMPRFLKRADTIIAVSECSKRDARRLYDVAQDKIRVIYEGVNPAYRPIADRAELERVRAKYQLPDRFLLYFGTIEPRKNLLVLLDAYQELLRANADSPRLVIAGRKGWLYQPVFDRVRALGLDAQVHFTDWVDEDDAPALMNLAELFVYPSLYEGFGLPPLEAMACGAPVICSNAASLPEIVGEGGLLFEPHDTRALVEAMSRMLENEETRHRLREAGLVQAQKFSWERAARETLQVYEEAAGRAKTGPV